MKRKLTDIAQAHANRLRRKGFDACADSVWSHPESYGGFSPDGDIILAVQHRDADALTRSNFACIARDLSAVAFDDGRNESAIAKRPDVYHFRAGCSLVGWIEYLLARPDRGDSLLEECEETLSALADYPVYDESHCSELEWNEAAEFWESLSVRDRAELIRDSKCGASLFAARRADLPSDDSGALFERLRG